MLVLTRKNGEEIIIDDEIRIIIKEIKGKQVRIGIEAPTFVSVYRGEIYRKIQEENRLAASGGVAEIRDAAELLKRLSDKTDRRSQE